MSDGISQFDASENRQVEQRPDGCPHRLRVPWLHRAGSENHAVRAEGVGAADHGTGVPGITDLCADHQQLGVGDISPAEAQLPADCDDPLRGHGV